MTSSRFVAPGRRAARLTLAVVGNEDADALVPGEAETTVVVNQ